MTEERRGRPYPLKELVKLNCHCCGDPARFQWNACADGNVWRPLCPKCDVMVNAAVLKVLAPKTWRDKLRAYAEKIHFILPRGLLK